MNQKPQQRRGLGRGLGSLIPTAPTEPAASPEASPNGGPHDKPTGSPNGSPASGHTGTAGAGPGSHPAGAAGATGPEGGAAPAGQHAPATAEETPPMVAGAYFAEVPVKTISPNPRQPRQVFEEEAMAELVHSVKEIGLLQPVVVRKIDDESYELIMGERRWRAMQEAGIETIPAIVRETGDNDLLRDALLENLHRAELNPLEEAAAYQQLLDDFGCTHDELANRIGRSRPQITNTLRLLRLTPAVQRRVAAGVLSAGHARALLAITDADQQDRLAARVIAEGISVRALEEIIAVGEYGGDEPKPKKRSAKPTAPGLTDLGARLSDRLETRVKVDLGKTKGRITVEFASIPDLERIVDIMDPKQDKPL